MRQSETRKTESVKLWSAGGLARSPAKSCGQAAAQEPFSFMSYSRTWKGFGSMSFTGASTNSETKSFFGTWAFSETKTFSEARAFAEVKAFSEVVSNVWTMAYLETLLASWISLGSRLKERTGTSWPCDANFTSFSSSDSKLSWRTNKLVEAFFGGPFFDFPFPLPFCL